MKKSKKGITLVELIICCGILVLLGGACTAVLVSGSTIFNESSSAAKAQMDCDVMQNHMMNIIPAANSVAQKDPLSATMPLEKGSCLYFDASGVFTISNDGATTTLSSVSKFDYEVAPAGNADSNSARAQFLYTVSFNDGSSLSGGFIMNNVKYAEAKNLSGDVPITGTVSEYPICFNATVPSAPESP